MVDVTVRGAGIFGLSVAWCCARRGAAVRVIDPNGPGAGASGGLVGALAPHVPENWNDKKAFQFESLIAAEAFWADVAKIGGQDPGYARLGRLQPIADAHGETLAHARAESAQNLWQGKARWRVVEAAEFGDWAPPTPSGLLIHDTLSARIHPRRACDALVAACLAMGVEILTEGPDQGAVVWATGVQDLDALSHAAGRVMGNGVKGQAALLEFSAPDQPQLFADGLHIIPHACGTTAIGSTSEREFENPTSTDALLEEVLGRAVALFPVLRGARVLERWAGLRPRARSRAPILGSHPLHAGAYIANGGFKIGFGMAPGVGEVMADLLLEGVDRIPDGFRPEPV